MKKILIAAAAALACSAAFAQYPNKPIRVIVPFPPGGAAELGARIFTTPLSQQLGQPIIIETRPGAEGIIASEAVRKSDADGYTLYYGTATGMSFAPAAKKVPPYDPVNDFTPISQALYVPFFIFVHPSLPANNVKELVDFLKANPNKVNFGSAGTGASNHLSAELFKSVTGVSMVHVPYKGSPPAVTDLLGGQIALMFETGPLGLPHAKSGKLKVIAVASRQRSAAMPELVTIAESGYPGFETVGWAGLLSPAGTPKEIITKLHGEVARVIAQPGINDRFISLGAELVSSSPEDFGAYIKSEIAKWGKVIRESGAKAD